MPNLPKREREYNPPTQKPGIFRTPKRLLAFTVIIALIMLMAWGLIAMLGGLIFAHGVHWKSQNAQIINFFLMAGGICLGMAYILVVGKTVMRICDRVTKWAES